jgi:hypothetical protein
MMRRSEPRYEKCDESELGDLKRAGQTYLGMSEEAVLMALGNGELQEIEYGEPQAS